MEVGEWLSGGREPSPYARLTALATDSCTDKDRPADLRPGVVTEANGGCIRWVLQSDPDRAGRAVCADLLARLGRGFVRHTVLWTSSKTGAGINEILPAVASRLPGATGSPTAPLQCLIFDSWFDEYRGVICIINVVNGTLRPGMTVSPASTGLKYHVHEVGLVTPVRYQSPQLSAGQVGVFSIYGILGRRCCRV